VHKHRGQQRRKKSVIIEEENKRKKEKKTASELNSKNRAFTQFYI